MPEPERTAEPPAGTTEETWHVRAAPVAPGLAEASTTFNGAAPAPGILVQIPGAWRHGRKVGVRLNRVGGADLIVPDLSAIPRPLRDRSVKRGLDFAGAILLLVVLSPVMALIAAMLAIEGGPVLFRQTRVGRNRTRFACLKFRSMRPDAEARLGALLAADPAAMAEWSHHQKLADDPRTTRLGRFLRASSLDELPQLVNVLRGEMSLVGPRPIIAPEIAGYAADRAYYRSPGFADYAGCLPGITGLWQIAGRHETAHSERARLDAWYARNWSVLLDLVILWRTIGVVLAGTGR